MSRPRRLATDLPHTTRNEIVGHLNMVIEHLQADPESVEERIIIERALRTAAHAAGQHRMCRVARNVATR